ncbi:MAG: hypothetical protein ABL886_06325 [Rhodoglobus sp.]
MDTPLKKAAGVALAAVTLALFGCSVPVVPGDPVPAPETDQTACLTSGSWTLDLARYTEDVATSDSLSAAPIRDARATGTLSITFTKEFLFASEARSFMTERTYDNDGETVVARWTRDDEVSGEWHWFDNETLVLGRVEYLVESSTNEAVVDGTVTVNFFPEPPRFYLSSGGPWRVTCSPDRLVLDSDGVIAWHFLPG